MSQEIAPSHILQSLSDGITEVAEKVGPSVVGVGRGRRVGSGVLWSPDGYIVTCSHTVAGAEVEVKLGEGRSFDAKVVGQDRYSDVALLKIEEDGLEAIELGQSENVRVGQLVISVANPFGQDPSVTSGVVTTARHSIRGWWGRMMEDVIVTDTRLTPGYSGGPLVDVSGRMLGLNAAYVSSRGIAVPVHTVKRIADQLADEGRIRRAYLGILSNTISLPPEIATQPQVNQDTAVIVFSVEADSPAKEAGLAIGDVLVKFDEKPVRSVNDLPKLLGEEVLGKPSKLWILRGEKPTELTITPGERTTE
ncbi:MAG: S1C family serine protease [Candidatus Geothermarchaeales archaeon]